jgi:predicted nucleic acid-binding protein
MTLLLDTNIVVDIMSERQGYENSLKLLKYCELQKARGFISVITVNDVLYILRKFASQDVIRNKMQILLTIVDVADVLKRDIVSAFSSGMSDYEDAVQAICAHRIRADYIVTHNLQDFRQSPVKAIAPIAMLELLAVNPNPSILD